MLFAFGFYGHFYLFWFLGLSVCMCRFGIVGVVVVARPLRFTHANGSYQTFFQCSDQYFNRLKSDTMLFIIIFISHSKFSFRFFEFLLFCFVFEVYLKVNAIECSVNEMDISLSNR